MAEEICYALDEIIHSSSATTFGAGKTQLNAVDEDAEHPSDTAQRYGKVSGHSSPATNGPRHDGGADQSRVGEAEHEFDPIEFGKLSQKRRSSSVPNVHLAETGRSRRRQARCLGEASGTGLLQCGILRTFQIRNHEHSEHLYSTLSFLYAMLMMVLGVAFPIAEMFGTNADLHVGSFEGFYVYLFIVSIFFLIYVQFFIVQSRETLYSRLRRLFVRLCSTCKRHGSSATTKTEHSEGDDVKHRTRRQKSSFNSHAHTGSFYLRLGAVGFGVGAMILDGLVFGQFIVENHCSVNTSEIVRPILQLIFTFMQMYFVFRNSKLCIHANRVFARFGLMHMVATNMCVWFRIITMETIHELHDYFPHHGSGGHDNAAGGHHPDNSHVAMEVAQHSEQSHDHGRHRRGSANDYHGGVEHGGHGLLASYNTTVAASLLHGDLHGDHAGQMECEQNDIMSQAVSSVTPYLYACTIEYSLICAGVVYLVWRNIGRPATAGHHNPAPHDEEEEHHHQHGKPASQKLRFNCSKSTKGLFIGIFMLIATIISMVVFFSLLSHNEAQSTSFPVMYVTELILYALSMVAVGGAANGLRSLRFNKALENDLDEILLLVAMIGVFIFCMFSAICGFYRSDFALGVLVAVTSVLVMFQTTVQTLFILNGLRRSAATADQEVQMPGREYVTFLVISNIALWAVNSFEVLRSESNPVAIEFYGRLPWSLITHVSVPLAIFYRFHSTVCLVDIWLEAYKLKEH